jgi:hypothetical protein
MKYMAASAAITSLLLAGTHSLAQIQGPGPGQSLLDPSLNNPPQPSTPPDPRDSQIDGTVALTAGSVAAGIGYVWGKGTVNFAGESHSFGIRGVSALDVGAAHIEASGDIMHLTTLKEFEGHYSAFGAGLTIAGGGSAVYLKNEHGVVIKLLSKTTGLRFNLAAGGVRVRLRD